jgi:hypothetical protein
VQRARALGVTLFDTAEIYGTSKSGRILGEALGDERTEVAVASKSFPIAPFPPVVKQRERASARRLQLKRIPLYQVHQPNPVVADSVIMPAMRSLLDSGDIGAAGVRTIRLRDGRRPTPRSAGRSSATRCSCRLHAPSARRPRVASLCISIALRALASAIEWTLQSRGGIGG